MDYRVGGLEISSKGKIKILKKINLIKKKISIEKSKLSKRVE